MTTAPSPDTPSDHRRSATSPPRRGSTASTCSPGATSLDVEAGGSEVHADHVLSLWARPGSRSPCAPPTRRASLPRTMRNGYRVIRRAGRYLVFPARAAAEAVRPHGRPRRRWWRSGTGCRSSRRSGPGHPRLVLLHHVHAEMWAMVLPPNLARRRRLHGAPASAPLLYRRSRSSPCRSRRKAEIVEIWASTPIGCTWSRPASTPATRPAAAARPIPLLVAVGRLVPVKRYDRLHPGGRRGPAAVPDLELVIVGEGCSSGELEPPDRRPRRRCLRQPRSAAGQRRRAARPLPARLGGRLRLGTRGLGHDPDRGRPPAAPRRSPPGSPATPTPWSTGSQRAARRRRRRPGARRRDRRRDARPVRRDRLSRGAREHAAASPGTRTATDLMRILAADDAARAGVGDLLGPAAPAAHPPRRGHAGASSGWACGRLLRRGRLRAAARSPHRGWSVADTKSYLYLDPGGLSTRAWSMWDPNIGVGTVTHQNIGYLWPMGPWFWAFEQLGVPDWVAQRLWLGIDHRSSPASATAFLAAHPRAGAARRGRGHVRSTPCRPTSLTIARRHLGDPPPLRRRSPWMLALTIRACRDGGWRAPGPLRARRRHRRQRQRHRARPRRPGPGPVAAHAPRSPARCRCGAPLERGRPDRRRSSSCPRLWWIGRPLGAGHVRHRHPPVHRDGPQVVAAVVHRPRGAARPRLLVLLRRRPPRPVGRAVGALPGAPPAAVRHLPRAGAGRWPRRCAPGGGSAPTSSPCWCVGVVLSVGAHPWGEAPPAGRAIQAYLESPRAWPCEASPGRCRSIALALAVFLGAAISVLGRSSRRAWLGATGVVVLAAASRPGDLAAATWCPTTCDRPEELPSYWHDLAAHLDDEGDGDPRSSSFPASTSPTTAGATPSTRSPRA